jgi:methyl-accepting chemotaxis protein
VSGGTLTKDSLQQKLDDAKSATDTLVSQLQDLGKPDVAASDELQQQLDSSADQLKASYQSLQSQAQDALSADSPAEFLQGLAKLAPQFGQLLDQIQKTVAELRSSNAAGDAKSELQQAFDGSDSCQSLRSGSS